VILKRGDDRIVVPMRIQRRARKAVELGVLDWSDDMCREIPPLFGRASAHGDRAAMDEAITAAETLLALLVEYRKRFYAP
jgi:hypothetical protein